jgi:F0F1-type ATP synthase assembly protein I
MVFTIAICFLLGYVLDRGIGSSPVFSLIGLALGLFTAFSQLIKMANKMSRSPADDNADHKSDSSA